MSDEDVGNELDRRLNLYESILSTIDDAVFIVNAEWEVEYANQAALARTNSALADVEGTPVMDLTNRLVVGDDGRRFETALENVFEDDGEFPERVVLEVDLPTGHGFAEYKLSPRYHGGDVTSAVVTVRDVTVRRRRKKRLHNLTEEYETIFENTEDAIFLIDVISEGPDTDSTFRVKRINSAYEATTGLTDQEVRGKTPRELLGDEDGAEIEANYRRCVESRESVTYEEELPIPEGNTIAQTKLEPVLVDGEVTQIVGISRDITERVEQKERLHQREQQLGQLHNVTRSLLSADTPQQVATMASEAADEILGLPWNGIHFYDGDADGLIPVAVSDEVRSLLDGVPVIDEGLAWETFQQGETARYDDVREAEDTYNSESPIRSESIIPLSQHGVFIVSSPEVDAFEDTDVELARTLAANTEAALDRINREQQLRNRERELERQNERLDEFTGIVSHDLRNPLNVAQGRLEIAREEYDSEHLETVADAHERMETLIDDLLTLSWQGETVDSPDSVRLEEVVLDCWQNVETGDATRITETEQAIRADRSRVRQLFENLMRNAVEHGGTDVTVRVGELPGGFYVADDGPGIPEDRRDQVFEAGYSTAGNGSGFGLNIAGQVVDAHDWDIAITGSDDGGARFEITGVTVTGE